MKLHWLLLALAPACMTEGDRAATQQCPDGETCSPDTPNGLLFQGTPFADGFFTVDGPQVTAVGGTQPIGLFVNGADQPPLTLPYHATTSAGMDVTSQSGSTIVVTGEAVASSQLRILSPDGELYDKTTIQATSIDTISLVRADALLIVPDDEPVVWAPVPVKLAIALSGRPAGQSQATRLVDTSMTIESDLDTSQTAWDELDVYEPPAAGDHVITVTAGDRAPADLTYTVVDHVDAIVATDDSGPLTTAMATTLCYEAHNAGRFVAGTTWTATSSNGTISQFFGDGCFAVSPAHTGALHVELTSLDASAGFDYTVGTATRHAPTVARPRLHAPEPRSMLGERAATTQE